MMDTLSGNITVQWKITRSLPKKQSWRYTHSPPQHDCGRKGSQYHLPVVFWLVHQFKMFSRTRMGKSMYCFYTHPWADKTNWGALISSEGNNTMDQVNQM